MVKFILNYCLKIIGTISLHEIEASAKNPTNCKPFLQASHIPVNVNNHIQNNFVSWDPFKIALDPLLSQIQNLNHHLMVASLSQTLNYNLPLRKWNDLIKNKNIVNLVKEDISLVDLENENMQNSTLKSINPSNNLENIQDSTKLEHFHGEDCGHNKISHEGHIDYIVDGKLHHFHDDHCDDHGELKFPTKKRKLNND